MQELSELEIDFHFDNDTQQVDGKPLIVFGESYNGVVSLRNQSRHPYVALAVEPEDPDMKITPMEDTKYILPGETRLVSFEIATSKARKKPFVLGVQVNGGYEL